jgi:hypothetical protein
MNFINVISAASPMVAAEERIRDVAVKIFYFTSIATMLAFVLIVTIAGHP